MVTIGVSIYQADKEVVGMELVFRPLTQIHALEIANEWKYDDIYSFYDMTADAEDYKEFID